MAKIKILVISLLLVLAVVKAESIHKYDSESYYDTNTANLHNIIKRYSNQHKNIEEINLRSVLDPETEESLKNVDALTMVRQMLSSREALTKLHVSITCQAALYQLFSPVLNITSFDPAVIIALLGQPVGKVLDSWGKPPPRLLLGNMNWIGAYDECNALDRMKFCTSTMYFAMQFNFPGTYGMCFPQQCTAKEIDGLLPSINTVLKGVVILKPDSVECNEPIVYDTGNYITLTLCGIIIFLLCVGTYTEMLSNSLKSSMKEDSPNNAGEEGEAGTSNEYVKFEQENKEATVEVPSNRIISEPKDIMGCSCCKACCSLCARLKCDRSWLHSFAISFSVMKNTKAIFSTASPKGAINSINGIRAISMGWVILGHMYFFGSVFGRMDNTLEVADLLHRFSFMAVSNAYVSVDTFFLLSGLLVAYLTFRRMDKADGYPVSMIFKGYLHRYIRLTPSIMFVMLLYVNIVPLIITGPFAMGGFRESWTEPCIDKWWTNILYINNFYPMGEQCIGWVWYLANDTQFFILSPFVLYAMYKADRRFENTRFQYVIPACIIGGLCIASMSVTAILMAVYNLPAVQTASGFPGNPKIQNGGKFGDYVYEKPYTRVTPYLVGLYLGYALHRRVKIRYSWRCLIVSVGWIVAIVTGLSVVYGTWKVFQTDPVFFTDAEDIIYEALHRLAWAVAVAWVIYACQNHAAGLVDSFLSWNVWIPLSRLTYGAYLLHPIVIFYFYFSRQTVFHYQDNLFVFHIISCTVMAYVASFMLAISVEYPVLNLEKKLLG